MTTKANEIEVSLPELYTAQYDALYAETAPDVFARYAFCEASTKSGKSAGCLIWQGHQVLERQGIHWWVAPVYAQAKIMFKRARKLFPGLISKTNESEMSLEFINGSIWYFKSGEKPDNLYGEDLESAIIDEASRMREESWVAIRSTLTATRGPVRVIGNTKGRGNWFYKYCQIAKANMEMGDTNWHYSKLTAYDAVAGGVLDLEEVEDAKKMLPDHVFRELYLAEVNEDGSNPFGITHIRSCVVHEYSTLPVAAWGWDLAKDNDWTVGIGLDRYGRIVKMIRFQKRPWPDVTRAILRELNAPAWIDGTGVGSAVYDGVMEADPEHHVEKFVFTPKSKQELMEDLAYAIQAQELGFLEDVVKNELESFEYHYTRTGVRYGTPEGYNMHDDCVCALALAKACLNASRSRIQAEDVAEWNKTTTIKVVNNHRRRPNARNW